MRRSGTHALAPTLLAALLLWGCAKEKPAAPPIVRKVVPKATAAVAEKERPAEPAAQKPPPPAEMYSPSGRRNPFLPFLRAVSKTGRVAVRDGVPPLQRYDLGELRFVGVIADRKGYRALIEDIEGKGYVVNRGTRLGRSGGVVSRISDGEIVVREQIQDYTGEKRYKENTLKLQSASAGGRR